MGSSTRFLEVKLIRAEDLEDVNISRRMDVYAVLSIYGDSSTSQSRCSSNHYKGHCNPQWHETFRFTIPVDDPSELSLRISLYSDRVFGDRYIGHVCVSLCDLLLAPAGESLRFPVYPQGSLFLSYKAGDPYDKKIEPPPRPKTPEPVVVNPPPLQPRTREPVVVNPPPPQPRTPEEVPGYPPPPPYAQWGPYPPVAYMPPYPPFMPPYAYDERPPPRRNVHRSTPWLPRNTPRPAPRRSLRGTYE